MKKRIIVIALFLMLPISLLAQAEIENPLQLNEGILATIFGAFGFGLFGIIAFIKRLFKTNKMTKLARDVMGYLISAVCSAGATAAILSSMDKFTIIRFALYSFGVWIEASGIWKGIKEAIEQHK